VSSWLEVELLVLSDILPMLNARGLISPQHPALTLVVLPVWNS
jgi:hypothetical protein